MKYLMPKSVTFWTGFIPLIGGLIVAAANTVLPGASSVAAFVNELSGNLPASVLILSGMGLIGLRAAV